MKCSISLTSKIESLVEVAMTLGTQIQRTIFADITLIITDIDEIK